MKHLAKQFHELNSGAEAYLAIDDYRQILLNSVPIIDVRSPCEFAQGAVPNTVNLPLLTDTERKLVGLAYKEEGQTGAVAKGLDLLTPEKRDSLVAGWIQYLQKHPNALICCWRGGLRSKVVQTWLHNAGWQVPPRIVGGSKALRAFCLTTIDDAEDFHYVVVAGRTGSGKTQLINELQPAVDLEGLALHRGSAFGGDTKAQPPPISFESNLAKDLLRIERPTHILIEDESRVIGRLAVPEKIFKKMGQSPIVVLQVEQAARVQYIFDIYVQGTTAAVMLSNLEKIHKRLGHERYLEVQTSLRRAYETQKYEDHAVWLTLLLQYYYDPMYDYQLAQKEDRVVFQGSKGAITGYLKVEFGFSAK